MNDEEMAGICAEAIQTFGIEKQKMMLVEECGELLTALAREGRGRSAPMDIITELADVSIMITQFATVYGIREFTQERDRKLERLQHRITLKKQEPMKK